MLQLTVICTALWLGLGLKANIFGLGLTTQGQRYQAKAKALSGIGFGQVPFSLVNITGCLSYHTKL